MEYRRKLDIEKVKNFISAQSEETKFYLGADSVRFKMGGVWYADYTVVLVAHFDGKHGAKIFGEITRERDYDSKKDKPALRLMNEIYKLSELFQKLRPVLVDRYFELHMDLNPDIKHGSSCVIQQAIGYIKGTCNVVPMVKPESWAASFSADRYETISWADGFEEKIA